MDKGVEVVLIGHAQRGVVRVEPGDHKFERAAGVEAGGARVGDGGRVNGTATLAGYASGSLTPSRLRNGYRRFGKRRKRKTSLAPTIEPTFQDPNVLHADSLQCTAARALTRSCREEQ